MVFTIAPAFFAYLYPYSKKLFSLLGSFLATLLVVTLPGLMRIKIMIIDKDKKLWIILTVLWCFIFTSIGFVCGTYLVVQEIKN